LLLPGRGSLWAACHSSRIFRHRAYCGRPSGAGYSYSAKRPKGLVDEDGAFADLEQTRSATFAYIEGYYNRTRRRSGLGYLSPENFERAFDQRTQRPG